MNNTVESANNIFERHLQTGLAVVLIGFVGWVGVTVSNNSNITARLDERMKAMESQLEDLKRLVASQMNDRYTGSQGSRLESRVEKLEERVEKIEDRLRGN